VPSNGRIRHRDSRLAVSAKQWQSCAYHQQAGPHAIVLPGAAALAQQKMDDMKGMDMGKKPAANAQAVHKTKATVKKVDAKAGSVTLAHEPVASLNWPAMTMGFKVKDSALMNKLTEGTGAHGT